MTTKREGKDEYMTIQEVANSLKVGYTRAYGLVVTERSIPHISVEGTSGARGNPKYLVLRQEVQKYKRRRRSRGRPRIGDGYNRGKRRNRLSPIAPLLSAARSLQQYRDEHGHFPGPGDIKRVLEGSPDTTLEG
jgi:hypothetical protein